VNSVTRTDDEGRPQVIRTTVFDATDRRGYERELLDARRRQSEIADELQRSLLSGSLPDHPGLEIGVEYRAGGVGLEVGGDWYDAFWITSGRTAGLVMGDVVGRGIGAAAKMGQLRSAVRALAGTGLGPGRLLDAAEQFVRRHDVGMNTTVVYAEVDLDSSTLRWACAGHPPPLLVKRDNEPVFLWEGRSPPLDAQLGEAPPRPIGTLQLDPGDLIVLYTDGLIERRGATIDEGLERLMQQASLHRDEPADLLARSVLAALYDPQHSDDGCLLACRVNGHVGRR
jgi:serine/threonine-protein kinase RsbW